MKTIDMAAQPYILWVVQELQQLVLNAILAVSTTNPAALTAQLPTPLNVHSACNRHSTRGESLAYVSLMAVAACCSGICG